MGWRAECGPRGRAADVRTTQGVVPDGARRAAIIWALAG